MTRKLKHLATPLCAVLLLLAATACKSDGTGSSGGGGSSAGGSGGNATPAASPVVGGGGGGAREAAVSADDKPLDVMTKAMRAQLDAKSYRAHVTTTLPDGTTGKMLIEYAAPDRYRMSSETLGAGGKPFNVEYVIVGGATFMKGPDGKWIKSPIDAGGLIKAFRDPKMLDELAKTADVRFVGADTLDGQPMLVYQYTQNNPMGMKLKSTSKTWVAAADGMPRKTETEGELNGQKSKTLITISDYNADFKIKAPIK